MRERERERERRKERKNEHANLLKYNITYDYYVRYKLCVLYLCLNNRCQLYRYDDDDDNMSMKITDNFGEWEIT